MDGQPPPPLRGKSVENGKSGSAFLVPGNTDPTDSATYSIIFKQLSPQEATLLNSWHASLSAQYTRPGGSLLAPMLGSLRCGASSSDREPPFDVMIMENVARRPPGIVSNGAVADSTAAWRPFDMKGIRLYPHERRYRESFGEQGLHIGATDFDALRAAISSDVTYLSRHNIVDFSYLVSVFPTRAAPRPCAGMAADADFAGGVSSRGDAGRTSTFIIPARVVPAFYRVQSPSTQHAHDEDAGARSPESAVGSGAVDAMCMPVVVRMAIIDYLRTWQLGERVEHIQKTLVRDLAAGERNHAVVPVKEFGKRFVAFFGTQMVTPVTHPTAALAVINTILRWADGGSTDATQSGLGRLRVLFGEVMSNALSAWGKLASRTLWRGMNKVVQEATTC